MSAETPARLVSLAAGVVQEFAPEDVVYAAAKVGFNAVGIWCELDSWTEERTGKVVTALEETGIAALDIEVVWFQPGEAVDAHDRFVEIARGIGARNILCVSSEPDIERTKQRFAHLCQLVEGTDIRVVLEFLAITEISTFALAWEVVRDVGHPAGGILVDSLHLFRTGSSVDELAQLLKSRPELFPYMQLCDADSKLADGSYDGILEDALYLRQLLGEGQLPLKQLLHEVDNSMAMSLEIRSRYLIEHYPTLEDRASAVFENSRQFFAGNA